MRAPQQEADLRLTGFASDFEKSIAFIRSVPVVIANERLVGEALSASPSDTAPP